MKTRKMYILQRSDGKFYWKGNTSSMWGYKENFEDAFLFKTKSGALSRSKLGLNGYTVDIKEVNITLN